jgi:tight adherence protein C
MTFFLDPQNLVLILAFAGSFAIILAITLPFLQRDQRAARLKIVTRRREELSQQQRERVAQERAPRRQSQAHLNLMKALLGRLNLENLTSSRELKQQLAAAGWRNQSAVFNYVFARFGAALTLALIAFLFLTFSDKFAQPVLIRLLISGVLAVAGFYLPRLMVKNGIQKRQAEMTSSFPDALDLLMICVESGLSIEAAFVRVTDEIAEQAAVLSQELGHTSAELAFLGDRRQAYANFSDRTGLPAAKSLSTALIQSEKYGTPVGTALKILAQENRDDRMAKAEKKAGSLPAQLTVPMIIFFLPVLFIVIIGPAVIQMMAL